MAPGAGPSRVAVWASIWEQVLNEHAFSNGFSTESTADIGRLAKR